MDPDVNPEEEIARFRAEMDQAIEGMRDVARTLGAFYVALTEVGFSDEQALTLVAKWLEMTGNQ